MSTLLGIVFLAGGPVVGSLCSIVLGATATWQIIVGGMLGQGVAVALGRTWSEYAAARTMRRALDATRRPGGEPSLASGAVAARPTNVVIRATGLTWRDHVRTLAVFSLFAVLLAALVAFVWRTVTDGH